MVIIGLDVQCRDIKYTYNYVFGWCSDKLEMGILKNVFLIQV